MTSIARRATPSQARIMLVVESSVKNAVDHHPDWVIDPRFASSIAKRAAGTLTAGDWPDVLAAQRRQTEDGFADQSRSSANVEQLALHTAGRGAQLRARLSPLNRIWQALSREAGAAKRAGNTERHAAIVDALRIVAAELTPRA